MMKRILIVLASLGLMASQAGRARGAQIIDQRNYEAYQDFSAEQVTPSFGQSFTPRLGAISFITTLLSSNTAASYRVDLYSGVGFGGTLLGRSAASDVPAAPQFRSVIQFKFASLITLTPGSAYSFRLVRESGSNSALYGSYSTSDTYSGGSFLSASTGSVFPNNDLSFAEGYDTALIPNAVPEPSTLAGAGLGLALLTGAAIRRRRKVA